MWDRGGGCHGKGDAKEILGAKVKDQSLGHTRSPIRRPVMDASSPVSSLGGGRLQLSVRRFLLLLSPLHSSHVSVTEVCPAARPHVKRVLSLSIKWCLNPHTPTPPICRDGYITARGFLGSGRFTTPTCSCCSLLSSIRSPRHTHFPPTRYILEAPLWCETHRIGYAHTAKAAL